MQRVSVPANKSSSTFNVAFLTKHQKGDIIQPVLQTIGLKIIETSAFDTDTLGTFSGDVERTLSPKDAALYKAKKAVELTGSVWGLGSEGSFGGGPYPGVMNWNEEILCLYNSHNGNALFASASGPSLVEKASINSQSALAALTKKFPNQLWMLEEQGEIIKGLDYQAITQRLAQQDTLLLKPDLRAMHCPHRQEMLANAAYDLVKRWQARCPHCDASNFVIKKIQQGLPCRTCTFATERVKSRTKICDECGFTEQENSTPAFADPMYCPICNP